MFNILDTLWQYLAGSKNKKWLKVASKQAAIISELESKYAALSDAEILDWAIGIRKDFQGDHEAAVNTQKLEQTRNEIYAAAREVAKRKLNMRHYDCQLIGGMVLDKGAIAEMKTGEGKTLVATLALIVNAFAGKKSFLVTVNDYLARRDGEWMKPLYEGMGLTLGIVTADTPVQERATEYQRDIIYITNNELGFDFLRDRMAFSKQHQIQPQFDFAIVDEVDSILIDEARTPLIISAPADQNTQHFKAINGMIPKLERQQIEIDETDKLQTLNIDDSQRGDYWVDEKNRQVDITEKGLVKIESLLTSMKIISSEENLYAPNNLNILQIVNSCLRAHTLFSRDVDYIVKDGEILLIDENTGRLMQGRRLSAGLHQAIECKENVTIRQETLTLASTTFQNFFRLFGKLSGMTGTAQTEAIEFQEIYGLSVVDIPTNQPMVREDMNDIVFMTEAEKYAAIVKEIEYATEKKIPVLVGTASVESSERLSKQLKKNHIKHEVLNAKNHAREAEIIAQAGSPGKVTISTNMAGRGTDIILGGNPEFNTADKTPSEKAKLLKEWEQVNREVIENGGLYVLACERHESRRTDNQLRGRAGRQGDPGTSRFFLSMEDNLIRLFVTDRIRNMMMSLGIEPGEAIEHRMLSNAIERAQKKVEQRNFEIRKNLLDYDNVANEQRTIVYEIRDGLLHDDDISEEIKEDTEEFVLDQLSTRLTGEPSKQVALNNIAEFIENELGIAGVDITSLEPELNNLPFIAEFVLDKIDVLLKDKFKLEPELQPMVERHLKLQLLDQYWRDHLQNMEVLRSSINLRAYAQRNPKQEYKRESFLLFSEFMAAVREKTVRAMVRVKITENETLDKGMSKRNNNQRKMNTVRPQAQSSFDTPAIKRKSNTVPKVETIIRDQQKVGRNEACPCGSGKKYKKCHGISQSA